MLIPNMSLILFSDVGEAIKNFGKIFQGLINIKEQNQLHIWNQYEKYYQMPYFKSFD